MMAVPSQPTSNAERARRHGLTIVYTGDGKGKTTAAVGLTVRAAGNRMRVFFLQFIKGQWKSGERDILRSLPGVDLEVTGRGAPPALIEAADLVSEVVPVKHPFDRGIKAQRGVEF